MNSSIAGSRRAARFACLRETCEDKGSRPFVSGSHVTKLPRRSVKKPAGCSYSDVPCDALHTCKDNSYARNISVSTVRSISGHDLSNRKIEGFSKGSCRKLPLSHDGR